MELLQAVTIVIQVLMAVSIAQGELEFRLSGTEVKSGRLEALYEGSWHAVDHRALPWNATQVVCRQMGYKYACRVRPCKALSREESIESGCDMKSNRSIILNINCVGTEKNVSQCLKIRDAETNLTDGDLPDVGVEVTCADEHDVDVRLQDGVLKSEGFLQLRCRKNGNWFVFCARKHLDSRDGVVVCRHLGQKTLARVERRPYNGAEEIASDAIFCGGDENHLLECVFNETQSNCSKTNSLEGAAWITCSTEILYKGENVSICGSDHSCKNRCWTWSGREDCKCDWACKDFGDCCYDFDLHCASKVVEQSNDVLAFPDKVPAANYTCFYNGKSLFTSMFYMVTKCLRPRQAFSNTTTEQCENTLITGDLLTLIPVFDSSGVVYRNVFCALCSGIRLSDVTGWYLLIEKGSRNYTNTTVLLSSSSTFIGSTKIIIQPPDAGQTGYPRWCAKYKEPSCEDRRDSSSFVAPLFKQSHTGDIYYYQNPLEFTCDYKTSSRINDICATAAPSSCSSLPKYVSCSELNNFRVGKTPAYISLLFDFSNTDLLGEKTCSKPGEIYDLFLRKCRFLGCPPDYRLHNEICEDKHSSAIKACVMDISNDRWPYDSIHLSKSPENEYNVFISAKGILGVIFLNTALQTKLISDSVMSSHDGICNASYVAIGLKTDKESDCLEPLSLMEIFNVPATFIPFVIYRGRPTLEEMHQETPMTVNCWERFGGDLRCDSLVLDSEDIKIIDQDTVMYKTSGMRIPTDAMKVNIDGTIAVCKDDLSMTVSRIVLGTHTLGSVLSLLLLLCTLVLHVAITNLRTLIRVCLLNVIAGLLVINIVLFFNDKISPFLCMIASILSHFAWIYTFTWSTNIFSIVVQTWGNKQKLLHMQNKRNKYFTLYTVTSWVLPWVVVMVSLFLSHCNCIEALTFRYGEVHFCWISVGDATKFVLGIPIGLLLFLDALVFIVSQLDSSRRNQPKKNRSRCGSPPADYLAAITLCLSLHGLALIGFLHYLLRSALLELMFPLALYLQSVFIFVAFVPFRKIVTMLQLRVRNCFHRCQGDSLENRIHCCQDELDAKYDVNVANQHQAMKNLNNVGRR